MADFVPVNQLPDGPTYTVSDIIGEPLAIPVRVYDIASQLFIADQLLRDAGTASSGVVSYHESNPLFVDQVDTLGEDILEVAPGAEIPVMQTSVGPLFMSYVVKKGGSIVITREMQDRNRIDLVNLQIRQVANSMARAWDVKFFAALTAALPAAHIVSAGHTWGDITVGNARPRYDILRAIQKILDEKRGFQPDTLILHPDDVVGLISNDDAWKAWFGGDVAHLSPAVTGKVVNPLFGLDVWVTYSIATGTAYVLERNTVGFISDERPLETTPLYYKNETQTWRTDTTRSSAVGIDQPLAAASITGIS